MVVGLAGSDNNTEDLTKLFKLGSGFDFITIPPQNIDVKLSKKRANAPANFINLKITGKPALSLNNFYRHHIGKQIDIYICDNLVGNLTPKEVPTTKILTSDVSLFIGLHPKQDFDQILMSLKSGKCD